MSRRDRSPRLPSWATPYLEDFDEILRVVDLSGGFVFLPVEVPGPDLAVALADWLSSKDHDALVNAPQNDEEWKALSTWLLEAAPDKDGVVVVIAERELPEAAHLALRLVNERRDGIAKKLGRPLLWCGPRDFLLMTAERAPDLWSVRAVERRILLKAADPQLDLLEEAKRQGDLRSVATLVVKETNRALAGGALREAERLLEMVPAQFRDEDLEVWGEIELLRAEVLRRRGELDRAEKVLLGLLAAVGDLKMLECRAYLLRGRVLEAAFQDWLRGRVLEAAFQDWEGHFFYREAAACYERARLIAAKMSYGALERLGSYREAALLFRREGVLRLWKSDRDREFYDRPLRALIMAIVATAMARSHDFAAASGMLADAIELSTRSADEPTILFGGEVEEEIRKAQAFLGGDTKTGVEKEETKGRKLGRFFPVAAVLASVLALAGIWMAASSVDHPPLFAVKYINRHFSSSSSRLSGSGVSCFVDTSDRIHCAPSASACEVLRERLGSAEKPCQRLPVEDPGP